MGPPTHASQGGGRGPTPTRSWAGFSGFQFVGGDSLESPVVITQWQLHELVVWTDPDDSTEVEACATIEEYDAGCRLKLWTRETVTTYERKKGNDHEAFGAVTYTKTSKADNPYRSIVVKDEETGEEEEGVLPFTFAHWNFPCSHFDTSSPGDVICQFNEHINRRLTMLGDAVEYQTLPILLLENVSDAFRFPTKIKPGDSLTLPTGNVDVGGNGIPAHGSYLAPPTEHLTVNWQELNAALDHMLEMNGVLRPASSG